MRRFAIFLCVFLVFVPIAIAYPQDQFNDCISSAEQNPSVQGVERASLEEYCDCALKLIVDEGRDLRDSGYECALKSFD